MAAETSKPKRKRRRWIIAGVLLFVVSITTWWYWPRGDVRFVGKWALSRTSQGKPLHIWHTSANGGGWSQHVSSGRLTLLNWKVDGNTLKLGYRWHNGGDALFRFRQWLYATVGWHVWIMAAEDWEIIEANADSIILQPVGSPETLTLTRLPDD